MLLADLSGVVAPCVVLELVPQAAAAFGAALIATESFGRGLLLVLLLRRRWMLLLLLLDLLLLLRMAPPPHLLLERSMQRILLLVRLELVQRQRIRRMHMIRQLEGVVVLLVDMNAKPLLQLVLMLALLVLLHRRKLLQVLLHRQLLQVLLHRRQRLALFAPLHLCICFALRSRCSTQSSNIPSRLLGARIWLSWKLAHRFDDTPSGLGAQ